MKWMRLLLLLLLAFPNGADAFLSLTILEDAINNFLEGLGALGIWDGLAKSLCNAMSPLLPEGFLECQCTGSFRAGVGLKGEFFCKLGGEVCLIQGEKKDDPDL